MEVKEFMLGAGNSGADLASVSDGLEQQVSAVGEGENLGVDFLEAFDSYFLDINGRLTISRMVSDAVNKGIVKAIEQEAEERIAAKESELASLRQSMHAPQLIPDKSASLVAYHENGLHHSTFDAPVEEHCNLREHLVSLRRAARGQIEKIKKEIGSLRECSTMKRISSSSELVGLGGLLQEKATESLAGVDRTLDTLNTTLDAICTRVDATVRLTLCEWQQEQELQREIEEIVIKTSVRSLHEEVEEKLWDQNNRLWSSERVNWLERTKEVSNLRSELDAILKSLSNSETGLLISHGSLDMNHLHRKVSPSASVWEGNGVFDESKKGMPWNWDAAQLKKMPNGELVNYLNSVITKMRRDDESKEQQMTEEYYRLKREFLKEKGSSLPLRKDKDLDIVRKKIPEVILKLDDIIVENEKLSTLRNHAESLGSMKASLNRLLLENSQLKDSLSDERKEVKILSSQVSDAAEKMLQHSLVEKKLLELTENLKSAVKDAEIKASISEEVYNCFLKEMSPRINSDTEELEMQAILFTDIYELLYRGIVKDAETASTCEIKESDIDHLITQGLCGVIFREALKGAQSQINDLNREYLHEKLVIEENEVLKQKVHLLVASLGENEKLALELSDALAKERKETDLVKVELAQVLEQIRVYKAEIHNVNTKLESTTMELRETDKQNKLLLAITHEKQKLLSLLEAKEKEQRKQMQEVIILVYGFSRALSDHERHVAESITKNTSRLEESSSELSSLIRNTKVFKRTALSWKQRLERRCADLQMAETEVDLLGDEVDALLGLLEKIYIALDHYSPILQHYPGIIEILKLVKRELNGESTKTF